MPDPSHDPSEPVVKVNNVTFSYESGAKVLDGVSLELHAGEHVCILGSNGSGKSTLARMLNGLLVPDSGSVEVLGMATTDASLLEDIRADCGIVFQSPSDQMVATTVDEDVAFGPLNLGLDVDAVVERVADSLKKVGLAGFEMRETAALSGGQQQRVAVAGALAMRSKVLVFDEATSMLDPRGRDAMLKLQRSLCDEGIAVVAITHFMAEATIADRIIIMSHGRIIADGTPEEIFANDELLEEESLAVPYAATLSNDLRREGLDVGFHIEDEALLEALQSRICNRARRLHAACDIGDPSIEPSRPVIEFDDVSYSYASKRELRRWSKSKDRARERRIGLRSRDKGLTESTRSWGAEPDSIWALEQVSLCIRTREILGIIGHTGSGKSTLLQLANGLLRATAGEVLIDGSPLHDRRSQAEALRDIGVVIQYPERQLFAQTVFDDVAFGPRNLGLGSAEVEERVIRSLEVMCFDPDEVSKASPFSLSGGQQRRVAIAGVLAMSPKVLMLDEPAAGLDPKSHAALLALLKTLRDEVGMTIAIVSHSMDDVASLCDRVLVLDKGRIIERGTTIEVFGDSERLKSAGLELPHALRYADALGIQVCGSIPTSSQLAEEIARIAADDAGDRVGAGS